MAKTEPDQTIHKGDLVEKISNLSLDARQVVHVEDDWLAVEIGGRWVGPLLLSDYRKVGAATTPTAADDLASLTPRDCEGRALHQAGVTARWLLVIACDGGEQHAAYACEACRARARDKSGKSGCPAGCRTGAGKRPVARVAAALWLGRAL